MAQQSYLEEPELRQQAPITSGNLYGKIAEANRGRTGFASRINEGQLRRGEDFKSFLGGAGQTFRQAAMAGTNRQTGSIPGMLANPQRLSKADIGRYNAMRTGQYTGPESLPAEEITARMQRTQALGNIRDAGALSELSGEAGGSRRVGNMRLNLALLSQPEERETLEQGYQRLLSGGASDIAGAEAEAARLRLHGETESAATRNLAQTQAELARKAQERVNIGTRRDSIADIEAQQNQIQKAIRTGGRLSAPELKSIGMSRAQWDNIRKDIGRLSKGFKVQTKAASRPTGVWGRPEAPAEFKTVRPEFDLQSLFNPSNAPRMTQEQGLTPEAGLRTNALDRLLGRPGAPAGVQYGGAPVGAVDPAAANRLSQLISRYGG